MIVFHLHCQLGNQMFIYACARSLAIKRKQFYCLSELRDLRYFKLSFKDHYFNFLKYIWFRIVNLFINFKFEHLQDNRQDYSDLMLNETSLNVWYYGYFQGEKYFYHTDQNIKKYFEVNKLYKDQFDKIKAKVFKNIKIIAIHIRLNDYSSFGPDYLDGPDLTLPFSYYHNIIKDLPKENTKFVFLSDNINIVRKEFSYINNAYFSDNSPIIDLQFLIHANTCILSCSTFSWWGAWLNNNKNKTIFAPNYFLGFKVKKEFPVNIIPEDWIKVEI